MMKFLQFIAVFSDLGIICCFLYALFLMVKLFSRQIYIRTRCRYRGLMEKPGRACVICDYQGECGRARKSKEYERYFFLRFSDPDQAQELFDEIRAEGEVKSKPDK